MEGYSMRGGGGGRGVILSLVIGCFMTHVTARGPPIIGERIETRQIIREGETLRLPCPVEADPGPALLEWSKDGDNIHNGWERFKAMSDSLRIKDSHPDDSGRYVCHAVNGFGSVDVIYFVWVHPDVNETMTPPTWFREGDMGIDDNSGRGGDPPYFSRPDQMMKREHLLPMGASLRLRCKATGKPKPQIIWFKDGKVLPEAQLQQRDRDDDQKFTLKLLDLQESDSGRYTCKVLNRAGAINFTYTLEVIDRLSKPIILDRPYNITVVYGDLASFQCNVHSQVTPNIQWLKRVDSMRDIRDTNNTITVEGKQFVVLKTGKILTRTDGSHLNKLNIYGVTEADSGMYICLAANSMGYNIKSAFLTVLSNPDRQPEGMNEPNPSGLMQVPSLPIIIAICVIVLLVVIIASVCVLKRRGGSSRSGSSTSGSPNSTKSSSVLRQPPPSQYPVQRHPMLMTDNGKMQYDHQYAALNPQLQPFLQTAPSREPIVNNYPMDMNSDTSIQKTVSPLPPHMHHMHIHPPQHSNIHYNMT